MAHLKAYSPTYQLPSQIVRMEGNLPRNPNGKIDRKILRERFNTVQESMQ